MFIKTNNEHLIINILGIKIKLRIKESDKTLKLLNYMYENDIYIKNKCVNIPNIKSHDDTLKVLVNSNKSICRYGDGEFNIILGVNIGFQDYSPQLAQRLKKILISKDKNIIIGIPDKFTNLDTYEPRTAYWWRDYMVNKRDKIYPLLDFEKQYYDSGISRPYIDLKNKLQSPYYFNKLKGIWNDKDIVFVEGEFSRLGYGNNYFRNAKSIKRIICPAQNAYDKYNEILSKCLSLPKESLIIIALGPTATVLAYDLAQNGYRALDLGHIDIEYEWFIRKSKSREAIKNKYVNEIWNGKISSKLNDREYKSEIIYNLAQKGE
ncbi:SP_1767 family glycosyltransferase [bacterium]|nr:SP_1767 family glycosyltransferase [bacterium]